MKKLLLILFSTFSFNVNVFSQDQHLIDSLQTQLKHLEGERIELRKGAMGIRDSVSAKILDKLSRAYLKTNSEKALDFAKQSLSLSSQIDWKIGICRAYNSIGLAYYYQDNYTEALENYTASLKILEETGNKRGIASTYINFGNIYSRKGNYPKALKNYFASLKLNEEIGDREGASNAYINIGVIYKKQNNYPEALKNYLAALKLDEETGNIAGMASSYGNIGTIYFYQGKYDEALKNYFASLKLNEESFDKRGMAIAFGNIANIYENQGKYADALKNKFASLKIAEEIGHKLGIIHAYSGIGIIYAKQNRIKEGEEWMLKALALSKAIGAIDLLELIHSNLAEADSIMGNYKGAFENYKMRIMYRDSLFNEENTKKQTQTEMQYAFDKKEALAKAEQEKKDALALEELENEKLIRNGFMGGFATVLLFAGTFFIQRNKIKKGKKRSDELLLNILPEEVAEELKETGTSKAKTFSMVSVMFTDFKDFTKISEKVSAEFLVNELHTCFSAFDNILHKHNVEKIKTIGDAYMCVSGLPVANQSHATDMVNAALEIMDYITARKKEKENKGEFSFELRIGINSGPVVAGIVGLKKFSYDIWGDTVNTAARIENQGVAGKINISGSTYEFVKDKFNCEHRGKITAKNKGEIDMYFVNHSPPEVDFVNLI